MATNQIALLAQVPEFDPLVPAQRQAQIRALAFQQEQQDLQRQQLQQAQADDASYRSALQANPQGGAGLLNALATSGNYKAHAATQKAEQERLKATADIGKTNAEAKSKAAESAAHQFELAGQLAGAWANNPNVTKAQIQSGLNAAMNSGIISPEIGNAKIAELQGTGDDPVSLNRWAQGTLTQVMKAKDQFALTTVDANTRANNTVSIENSKRTAASAAADRVSREKLAREGQAAPQYDTERGVLVDRRAGTARQVTDASGQPLGAKDKPLTEFQGKSAAFADRALLADQALSGLSYDPAAINSKAAVGRTPLIGGALEAATNAMLSPENQQAEQAQRDFINAVLRQESGAAIGASEFDNARKQYFPQPGDSKEVIAQKAVNRKTAITGLQRNAGTSYKKPATPGAASAGTSATNARGWTLHVDANGNRAYVSQDGKQFEEVR